MCAQGLLSRYQSGGGMFREIQLASVWREESKRAVPACGLAPVQSAHTRMCRNIYVWGDLPPLSGHHVSRNVRN